MLKQISVEYDQKQIIVGLLITGAIIGIIWILYSHLFLNGLIGACLRLTLIIIEFFFLSGFFYIFINFYLRNDFSALIITQKGLWIRHYGFLLWSDIQIISLYEQKQSSMSGINIYVYDLQKLYRQASLIGKCGIFWLRWFNNPHIYLTNLISSHIDLVASLNMMKNAHENNNKYSMKL